MKKIKSYILILILSFLISPIITFASGNIENIKINISILKNGDALITEYWTATLNEGTEIYKPYFNLGNSEIKNFTVKEENVVYEYLDRWDSNKSFNEKKYKNGINYVANGLELCWGMSSYGKHIYQINYKITKFVKGYQDAQLLYFTLINPGLKPLPESVEINITTDNLFPSNTLVWGYGWDNGVADIKDGKLIFTSDDGLNSYEYITILVKLPLDTLAVEEVVDETFENIFWKAEEGVILPNVDNNNYLNFSIKNILDTIFPIFIFVAIFAGIYNKAKFPTVKLEKKDLPRNKDLHYFREIPCNKDLFYAYWLGEIYSFIRKKENLFGAILLKWIQKDNIKVIKDTKGVFKRETSAIDFTKEFICDNDLENELKGMLLNAAGFNKILEEKEFKKWAELNYEDLNNWFDKVISNYTKKLMSEGLVYEESYNNLGIFKEKRTIATLKTNEEAVKLLGLKKYLEEFSSIDEKKAIEVKLWNEYLIFAQVLGVADKVAKEFEKVYPNYVNDMQMSYSMSDIYIINHISNSGIHSAESAHQAHINRMNSGGGGGSFSGGGGGSFGGGGSGGGFR